MPDVSPASGLTCEGLPAGCVRHTHDMCSGFKRVVAGGGWRLVWPCCAWIFVCCGVDEGAENSCDAPDVDVLLGGCTSRLRCDVVTGKKEMERCHETHNTHTRTQEMES